MNNENPLETMERERDRKKERRKESFRDNGERVRKKEGERI